MCIKARKNESIVAWSAQLSDSGTFRQTARAIYTTAD